MKLILVIFLAFSGSLGMADQKATVTCTGENVILQERAPYMGEDHRFTQSLWVLKSKDDNDNESKNTTYFLNIMEEGAAGRTILTGHNEVMGYFQLDVARFYDIGDGTVIKEHAAGYLDYHQGPLKGEREKVNCIRE